MSSQARQEYEDDGDWTERFIQEIQSKPPIYNTGLPAHSDRNVISRLWNEINEAMVPACQDMSANEKSAKGKELQNKWRNLKTCFRRELKKQKQGSSGQAANKRRKYVYFDQLLFLLPILKDRPTVSECSPSNVQENNSESKDDSQAIQATDQSQNDELNDTSLAGTSTQTHKSVTPTCNRQTKKKKKTPNYEETLLNILKEKKEEVIDEDKSFLLSLVPSFKKLNDVQKFDAKLEFLSTLKRLSQINQQSIYHIPQGHGTYPSYGSEGSVGNYIPRQNPFRSYSYNVETYPSGSSTPNPTASDMSRASRGSSFEPASPANEFSDFS